MPPIPTDSCPFLSPRPSRSCSLHWHIPRLRIHCSASMSPRLIFRRYTEIRREDALSSPKSSGLSGGPLAAAIVLPVVFGSLLVVFTVLWYRRAQRRRVAEHDSAHAQQPVSADAVAPTESAAAQPNSPPPPPPPSKSPRPPEPPSRRPSLRERMRISLPALAARLSGGSGGTRGSGGSRADPVLPRIQVPPTPQLLFNSDDRLAPRRPRPRSAQQRATALGPPLSPPPTLPLPPTPTSASAGGTLPKEREGEWSESERSNGRGKPKVRPLPLPPVPDPKALSLSMPVVLRPNRLGETGLSLLEQQDLHQPQQQEGHQQEAVLLIPRGQWGDRGPDSDSDMMPPPYTSPAYGTRSRP
ncbi:hypothetical protein BJY52DRAFT_607013 [Lactarius psammicola]|nr:hypothetical protein BJY52DRAFT_607013 [Lactarius psammicola]